MRSIDRKNPWHLRYLMEILIYRQPMRVTEMLLYQTHCGYYICPRCHIPMEREFAAFCDRCGQRLDWKQYRAVKIIRK